MSEQHKLTETDHDLRSAADLGRHYLNLKKRRQNFAWIVAQKYNETRKNIRNR